MSPVECSAYLCAGGVGLATDMDYPEDTENRKLNLGHGGLMIGYTSNPQKTFHMHAELLVRAGGVVKNKEYYGTDAEAVAELEEANTETDRINVMEPSVMVEMNVKTWMIAGVGAAYRLVDGSDTDIVSNEDLSGGTGLFALKFRKF